MDVILANVAVWGLGFALLNLLLTVDKVLRDPGRSKPIKFGVAVGAAILVVYALSIGVFAAFLLFDGAETVGDGIERVSGIMTLAFII